MVTPETWSRFVDDASPLPEGPVPRRPSPAVGARVVREEDLPRLLGYAGDVRVVLTGGAGQVAGPSGWCVRHEIELVALDTTVRDLDDPAGNARRVVAAVHAARANGDLRDDTLVHVRVAHDLTASWLAAADVLAEAAMVVVLSLDAGDPEPWLDAAMDRELEVSLVGGTVEQAVAALGTAARLWGEPGDLSRGRRWIRSWVSTDVDAALVHLGEL
ncbi:MAG: hypothetical protein LH468_10870 [Nocardioides sp.]|nr:hypothetical protein [Nocardioides sp.]